MPTPSLWMPFFILPTRASRSSCARPRSYLASIRTLGGVPCSPRRTRTAPGTLPRPSLRPAARSGSAKRKSEASVSNACGDVRLKATLVRQKGRRPPKASTAQCGVAHCAASTMCPSPETGSGAAGSGERSYSGGGQQLRLEAQRSSRVRLGMMIPWLWSLAAALQLRHACLSLALPLPPLLRSASATHAPRRSRRRRCRPTSRRRPAAPCRRWAPW